MKHGINGRKFGRDTNHRKALLRNLATSLITHGRIVTTLPKAKDLRPYIEKLITKAKKGGLHNIRQVDAVLFTDEARKKLFSEIVPLVQDRNGGYVRIYKYGFRKGDGGARAIIEIIGAYTVEAQVPVEA